MSSVSIIQTFNCPSRFQLSIKISIVHPTACTDDPTRPLLQGRAVQLCRGRRQDVHRQVLGRQGRLQDPRRRPRSPGEGGGILRPSLEIRRTFIVTFELYRRRS